MASPINRAQPPTLEKWSELRQLLIARFWEVLPYLDKGDDTYIRQRFCEFSQTLIDYLAMSHFQAYAALLEKISTPANGLKYKHLDKTYDNLIRNTQEIMKVQQNYEEESSNKPNNWLRSGLSKLGKLMSDHLDMEDHFIKQIKTLAESPVTQ